MSRAHQSLPAEVVSFLNEADVLRARLPQVNVFDPESAEKYSSVLKERVLGAQELGLIPLCDFNDSNPFCFVSRSVAQGMVLHLFHDDEPRFAFSSLQSFKDVIIQFAGHKRELNWAAIYERALHYSNQDELENAIANIATRENDESTFVICLLLQLLTKDASELLGSLAKSEDFFLREAVAVQIRNRPRNEYLQLAIQLSKDSVSQVRREGVLAAKAVRSAPYG